MALVRTMAQEWGPHGIRMNAVAPDMIATPRVLAAYADTGNDPDDAARADGAPLGRFGTPEEIAGPAGVPRLVPGELHHGQTIVADGGQTAPRSPTSAAPASCVSRP